MASPAPAALTPSGRSRVGGGSKTPLKSPLGRTQPNDDAAEKERAAQARAANELRRRLDGGRENQAPAANAASGAAEPQRAKQATLSTAQVLDLYSNCIKLASENKINAKNTWSLQLIDHLSDLVKAEKDDDTSTNFQKASCTLDAGVKIYASRVDSVHTETFKVLGGLSRSAAPRADEEGDDGEDGDGEEGGEEGEEGGSKEPAKGKARRGGATATLEAPEAHTSRALEEAVAVDPLFQKTSAQFDEGGAAGLLMNALSVHRGCDTVFDSAEVPDYAGADASRGPNGAALADLTLDLSGLAPALAAASAALAAPPTPLLLTPTLAAIRALLPGGATDTTANAAATAASRSSSSEEVSVAASAHVAAALSPTSDAWAEGGLFAAVPPGGDGAHDGSCAAAYEEDMYSGGGGCDYGGGMDDDDDDDGCAGVASAGGAALVASASAAATGRFQMGNDGVLQWVAAAADAGGAQQRRAWAGASHWRFRSAPAAAGDAASVAAAPTRSKAAKKGPFFIDFTAALPALEEALFRPPAKASDARLTGAPTPADTLLPADLRYAPAQLVRLFLKPGAGPAVGARSSADADAHADEHAEDGGFANDAVDYDDDDGGYGGGAEADFSSWPTEAPADGAAAEDGGVLAVPRRVEQIKVNYARSAKVVDVRALKAALWDGVKRSTAAAAPKGAKAPPADVSFATLLQSVTPDCGAGALSDVSVHMCFICVLHLANENGLAIKGAPSLTEMRILQPAHA